MINGFEKETAPLTAEEKENAVTSKEIQKQFGWANLEGARLRKLVNYIRLHGTIKNLVATSRGYYCTLDPVEVERYRKSLEQRAAAILAVRDSFVIVPQMKVAA